jgi:ubiquinone/menaquinone biosynthesis C-methylase UbiE
LPQGKLLDLGAGQGQDSRYFAQNGYAVLCTDFCEFALDLAQKKAQQNNLPIEFRTLDLRKPLSIASASFDIVYSHLALHYFDETTTQTLIAEIHRVLKKGGIFAVLLNNAADPEYLQPGYKQLQSHFYLAPWGETKRFFTVESLQAMTQDFFQHIVIDDKGKTVKDNEVPLIRFIGSCL